MSWTSRKLIAPTTKLTQMKVFVLELLNLFTHLNYGSSTKQYTCKVKSENLWGLVKLLNTSVSYKGPKQPDKFL